MVTAALTAETVTQIVVSQKGRTFTPDTLSVDRGATVTILNDDADLLHHTYIDAPNFTFDSGDTKPGGKTDIAFTVPGTFNVLCAIHPKMKLTVTVK